MSIDEYILSIDQGTTGTTVVLVGSNGRPIGHTYREISQYYPKPGWVEHDPEEIWTSVIEGIDELLMLTGVGSNQLRSIGITNQRQTTVIWDADTGKPVCPAVVWQCRRTQSYCDLLKERGLEELVRESTGLTIDPYFSATKIRWILDSIPDGQKRAEQGELLFGTIDSWLIWRLSGGRDHLTDITNAATTMLYDITTLSWSGTILTALNIPVSMLPTVVPCSGALSMAVVGIFKDQNVAITGVIGDQQSALFGQMCFDRGMVKCTYGTGAFILMNTGDEIIRSSRGLLTTVAWQIDEDITYALEGSVFSAGATVQWLRDGLNFFKKSEDIENLARSVDDSAGVYLVPAFTGLGTPYWDSSARGVMVGLTRGVNKGHIARAALESIAFQCADVIEVMGEESGISLDSVRVDGGASKNTLLMEFQANISQSLIERPVNIETTVLGAGFLSGIGSGLWLDKEDVRRLWESGSKWRPEMDLDEVAKQQGSWRKAVTRAMDWI